MRLKSLELLGYKTFATRTYFEFNGGITAIIGPNGSGKSNVADAVRWVLGEQSFSLLRAKKSEDMIFSGSERRARMGMAEVTITLDNSDRWLDVDFTEVAITRRSYRSGENEYLLNGSRVRLRDVGDLLAKSGLSRRTYTVVGQGLVDAALSLRPQERRALIEEAAGLTLYQSRRANALSRLEETQRNVLRVHDLIGEIEPRVKRLQRQAEKAQEYALIREDLNQALRVWYSYQWRRGQEELRRARGVAKHQLERLAVQRAQARQLAEQIAGVRARQGELRGQLSQWHHESSALHARSEALQRDLAVLEERRRLLVRNRDELLSDLEPLQANAVLAGEQMTAVEAELQGLSQKLEQELVDVQAAEAAVERRRALRAELQAVQSAVREQLMSTRTQIAEHDSRLAQLGERKEELQQSREGHAAACQVLEGQIRAHDERQLALQARIEELNLELRQVEQRQGQMKEELAGVQQQQRDLLEQRNRLDQQLGRLRERHELLARMREEGEGLYDGVRSVLSAAARLRGESGLRGIVGTVARLIRVPEELETAIETALGGQLQDVVVESWSDAEAAIDYLKRTRTGRATFLPLDALKPSPPVRPPRLPGVLGAASELVQADTRFAPVMSHLLGRTVVCKDLPAARTVLGLLEGSYQIVTLEGELVRSSGAVSGGTAKQQRQGGMLAREREWRDLPARLAELDGQSQRLNGELCALGVREKSLFDNLAAAGVEQQRLEGERSGLEQERGQVEQLKEQASREREWRRSLMAESEREVSDLDSRQGEVMKRLSELYAEASQCEARVVDLDLQVTRLEERDLEAQLTDRRAALALTRQQHAAKEAELAGIRRTWQQIEQQIADRRRRVEDLGAQLSRAEGHIEELRGQEQTLHCAIQVSMERTKPVEGDLVELEGQQLRLEREEGEARTRLQAAESRYGQIQIEVARQEDHMNSLRQQIRDAFGLVDLDMGDELSGQPPLPLSPLVSSLPEVDVLPEGLEGQIADLKRRLRYLEPVNPDAPEEYEEARQRCDFLSRQARDLEQASTHLREVIAELDNVMEHEFRRTFHAVSRGFRDYFEQLFEGGSARLELTDPDDLVSTGIDIVVRPPGKRLQGLAVLSGGERALTAAALVFSILTVSPTPFCVLDEVDAALDEANVGRFRAALQNLAKGTQFVIITHNRYTIEIADTVYGISMGADGSSCVISHQLNRQER